MKWFALVFSTSLISALLAIGLYRALEPSQTVLVTNDQPARLAEWTDLSSRPTGPAYPASAPTDFILAADRVTPAVVNIRSVKESEYSFLGFDEESSTGSGVILSPDGFIVTNYHVIANGNRVEVTLNDKREYLARVIGTDPSTDIAVIRIDVDADLPYVDFANSDSLRVGEWVVAVGNPFNLESTVTAGIVSAKGRSINILDDMYRVESFIQTDAVINPGNSGGALVNTRGDLIGINTAIVTKSGKYEGYSFAVPSNLVMKVVGDIREFGTVQRGILGINVDEIDQQQAREAGVKPGQGVLITRVNPGSAAYEGGLRRGDVIMAIDSRRIHSVPELQEQVARARPGQTLTIRYSRDGEKTQTEVTLQQIKQSLASLDPKTEAFYQETGMGLRELNEQERQRFRQGAAIVEVIDPGSKADQVNMEPNFIIERINSRRVKDLSECLEALGEPGKVILEGRYTNYPGEFKYIFLK
ncbi:MAG: trypsin-like peptidase domain-containing protein [Lewinellaceae bacterium]|nr:trypsin-like peptidase domain-containing protein [Saprospiraceae bacterium]MCB9311782.1 trypsin-like peptidase domain-containing protein [Lewinellaceae bacterium]